jgi:hypothetical protein
MAEFHENLKARMNDYKTTPDLLIEWCSSATILSPELRRLTTIDGTPSLSGTGTTTTILKKSCKPSAISIRAGCGLFERFVKRTASLQDRDFDVIKAHMIQEGNFWVEKWLNYREIAANYGVNFIKENMVSMIAHELFLLFFLENYTSWPSKFTLL